LSLSCQCSKDVAKVSHDEDEKDEEPTIQARINAE
jgi:hypothetical protein